MTIANIAAVVVWYNPEKEQIKNLHTYLESLSRLYIIDNSEKPDLSMHEKLSDDSRIHLVTDRKNYGIAKALNIAIELASNDGFSWLLTMDQDSFFEAGVFRKYLTACIGYRESEKVAVFGLPFDPAFLRYIPSGQVYVPVDSLITSGNLLNIHIAKQVGGFNEKLFIDEVDHEFCFRSRLAGFEVICVRTGLLSHSLGIPKMVHTISGSAGRSTTLHAPVRLYYIVRNGLYVSATFAKTFPAAAAKRKKIIYVTIKNNLLYGNQKGKVLKFAVLGYLHYIKNRYYKL